jgi:hypothetical protein
MFAWHIEDLNLGSINYHHYGKPKFWYCISSLDYKKFEAYVKNKYPEAFLSCPEYLRHKTILVNPYLLKEYNPNITIFKFNYQTGARTWGVHNYTVIGVSPGVQPWIQYRRGCELRYSQLAGDLPKTQVL